MQKILIATPCLDQKVDAYFVHSLCESIKLGLKHDLDIRCIFLANESILPMARNELLNLAHKQEYDQMVFIDDDELWDADILIEILLSKYDVITVPVVNKTDTRQLFNTVLTSPTERNSDGYYKVDSTGTGFLKLSKECVKQLWDSNEEVEFRGNKLRNICEFTVVDHSFVGEDINLVRKIKALGFDIWCNSKHTVSHIGNKIYRGNFEMILGLQ